MLNITFKLACIWEGAVLGEKVFKNTLDSVAYDTLRFKMPYACNDLRRVFVGNVYYGRRQ